MEDKMDNGLIQALLIGAIILLYTLQSLFSKMFNDAYPGDPNLSPNVFSVVSGIVVALVSLFFTGFKFGEFRWETLLLGIINAVIVYGYDQFIIKASGKGPYSIMMVFNLGGGIVIPALVSPFLPFSPFSPILFAVQMVAVVIICVSIYLVSAKKEDAEIEEGNKSSRKVFIVISALLAIMNGLYGVIYVVHNGLMTNAFSHLEADDAIFTAVSQQKQMLVIYSFLGVALISAIRLLATERKKVLKPFVQTKKSLILLILASVVSAMAVNVLVLLVGVVNETLLYTFDNAGVMLLSALASALIFKDKLSTKNIIGCVVMTLALVMMGASDTIAAWFGA